MNSDKKRILVIDDDEDILETLHSLLVRKGYDAITANSGAAAIERSEESVINLALIDIVLPDMEARSCSRS
jgi:DNA-binding response OmpR family regulator